MGQRFLLGAGLLNSILVLVLRPASSWWDQDFWSRLSQHYTTILLSLSLCVCVCLRGIQERVCCHFIHSRPFWWQQTLAKSEMLMNGFNSTLCWVPRRGNRNSIVKILLKRKKKKSINTLYPNCAMDLHRIVHTASLLLFCNKRPHLVRKESETSSKQQMT